METQCGSIVHRRTLAMTLLFSSMFSSFVISTERQMSEKINYDQRAINCIFANALEQLIYEDKKDKLTETSEKPTVPPDNLAAGPITLGAG